MFNKLLHTGELIDELDILLIQHGRSYQEVYLKIISEIEDELDKIEFENLDDTLKIVFLYTNANYEAILKRIADNNFEKLKSVSKFLGKFDKYEYFLYNNYVQRIDAYRKAIKLSKQVEKLNPYYLSQIYVNLANVYIEMGRVVESIDELKKVEELVDFFPMAKANLGIKHLSLAQSITDRSVMRFLIEQGIKEIQQSCIDFSIHGIPEDIGDTIFKWKENMEQILKERLSDVEPWNPVEREDSKYKEWAAEKNLSLSYANIIYKVGSIDDIQMINLGISYFGKDKEMTYYAWFNTLKQEYNMARYFVYKVENDENLDIHESQKNNLLINTLDYPALGYRTELLKMALKTGFSVLDKIGLFCCKFHNQLLPTHRIDFHKWYKEIEFDIALNSPFNSLYWLSKDLDLKVGEFRGIRLLRNAIEHRFIRVLDYYHKPILEELSDPNKYEYKISFSELLSFTYKTLKLVRTAIFYMTMGFNIEFNRFYYGESEDKLFIPLMLDVYEDEWKN